MRLFLRKTFIIGTLLLYTLSRFSSRSPSLFVSLTEFSHPNSLFPIVIVPRCLHSYSRGSFVSRMIDYFFSLHIPYKKKIMIIVIKIRIKTASVLKKPKKQQTLFRNKYMYRYIIQHATILYIICRCAQRTIPIHRDIFGHIYKFFTKILFSASRL